MKDTSEQNAMEFLTSAQMRGIEQTAMDSGSVTGLELMERAGDGVLRAIFAQWPAMAAAPGRALVLCGPGNNGGDGFVVARLLLEHGWDVSVWLLSNDEMPSTHDALVNAERLLEMMGPGAGPEMFRPPEEGICEGWVDLVVDAVFGTGLTRAMDRRTEAVLGLACAHRAARVVAIDAISGFCLDSGRWLVPSDRSDNLSLTPEMFDNEGRPPVRADLVVTFHRAKPGHVLGDHAGASAHLRIVDIGLEGRRPVDVGPRIQAVDAATLPVRRLAKGQGHKYGHGHGLVLSGPMGRSGAARLAARGALRVGAGLVTVAAPGSAMMECAAQQTAIMLRKCDGVAGLAVLLEDARINALCLGPGLGLGQKTRDLVACALAPGAAKRSAVLDADALSAFSGAPQDLFDLTHPATVITPHEGEFSRLFPDIAARLHAPPTRGPAYSKVDATRDAAARAGCVVLFKGPDTVIAHPDGAVAIHAARYTRAAPWLATAGAGDVLSGIITGLLARGFDPMGAAQAATWLHVEAARAYGPGLIAEDLSEMLPQVFRDRGL